MKNFLAGIWMSFLPRAWWGSWEPESTVYYRWSTLVSGLLQFLFFFLVAAHQVGGVLVLLIMLVFSMIKFLLHPLRFFLGYFMFEGAVRAWAAFNTEETLPSFPFWLTARLHGRAAAKKREEAMGRRVADLVETGTGKEYDLRISSCRPKEGWKDELLTIAFEEQFYEVVREERGRAPRQFVYLLRKAPESKVIRGVHHYHPDEALPDK